MRYKIDIFYMYVDILLDTLYILDIILNNSHWDNLVPSYLFSFKKQNYKSMTKLKKLDVTIMSSMNLSLLILKISLLTLFGCGVKIHKINPVFGYRVKISTLYMVWSNCPDDSKKVKQLYVDLMLLVISLLTLLMSVGFNIPLILTQFVIRWVGLVLRFLTIYNTCMFV